MNIKTGDYSICIRAVFKAREASRLANKADNPARLIEVDDERCVIVTFENAPVLLYSSSRVS